MAHNCRQRWCLGCSWNVFVFLVLVVGLILWWSNPLFGNWIEAFCERVRPDAWGRLIGILLVSMGITHYLAFYLSRALGCLLELPEIQRHEEANLLSPAILGLCESIMYPTALVMQKAEFIGVWLALKVAGQWVRWGGELAPASPPSTAEPESANGANGGGKKAGGDEAIAKANEGRRRFNRFLIGNALQVMAAVLTYGVLKAWALR